MRNSHNHLKFSLNPWTRIPIPTINVKICVLLGPRKNSKCSDLPFKAGAVILQRAARSTSLSREKWSDLDANTARARERPSLQQKSHFDSGLLWVGDVNNNKPRRRNKAVHCWSGRGKKSGRWLWCVARLRVVDIFFIKSGRWRTMRIKLAPAAIKFKHAEKNNAPSEKRKIAHDFCCTAAAQ